MPRNKYPGGQPPTPEPTPTNGEPCPTPDPQDDGTIDLCCGELDEPNAWGYLEFCEDEHPHPHYPPYPYPYPCPPYPCPPNKPKRAKIKLHVKCACPVYKDAFHVFAPNIEQEFIQAQMAAIILANPGSLFGSLLDLDHVGWLLHYKIPV